jgi:hypothetical protein
MVDEKKDEKKSEEIGEKEDEKRPVQMTITMSPEGDFQVAFPFLANMILTYGFIEIGKRTLDNFYTKQTESKIVKPQGGILDFARRLKH